MRAYGDIEVVNLASGQQFQRVTGDGESRLVPLRPEPKSVEECDLSLLINLRPTLES